MENLSELQIIQSRDFSGLSETNHLISAYLVEPELMEGVLSYAFGVKNNNILSLLTGGLNNVRYVNGKNYHWDIHGQTEIVVRVGKTSTDGGSTAGLSGSQFRIFLEENHFELSDNLRADDGTMVRVVKEGYQEGNYWVYWVQLCNPDLAMYIDAANITIGAGFSKMYSTVEEYSNKGGGTHFSTPVRLTNQLTTLRKHFDVSRNAAKAVMRIELPNPENPKQKTTLWANVAEWTAIAQWYRELDRSMIYTEYNSAPVATYTTMKGETGRPVYHGAGFRQQIAPSNRKYYTSLSYQMLDDFLLDLSYSAQSWGGNTKFVALTGKMGFREFDRAIRAEQNARGITVTDSGTFITGSGMELKFTGGFKTVEFLNGIELTLVQFDPYDDLVHNRQLHPVTKRPIESYRFSIMNFGADNKGANNIRKVCLTDSENAMWTVAGSTDPMQQVAKSMSTLRGSSKDGYRVEFLSECGIQVQDPTSCGELIMELD